MPDQRLKIGLICLGLGLVFFGFFAMMLNTDNKTGVVVLQGVSSVAGLLAILAAAFL